MHKVTLVTTKNNYAASDVEIWWCINLVWSAAPEGGDFLITSKCQIIMHVEKKDVLLFDFLVKSFPGYYHFPIKEISKT